MYTKLKFRPIFEFSKINNLIVKKEE